MNASVGLVVDQQKLELDLAALGITNWAAADDLEDLDPRISRPSRWVAR